MKVRGDFLGPPRSTDKTTLIIKVSNGAKIRNRYNQVPFRKCASLVFIPCFDKILMIYFGNSSKIGICFLE